MPDLSESQPPPAAADAAGDPDSDPPPRAGAAPPPAPPWDLPPRVEVAIHLHTPDTAPPTEGWLYDRLCEAVARCGVTQGRLDVSIIDDAQMQQLHAEHCDDPTTTDVLTFDLLDDVGDGGGEVAAVEGDIMVCRDEAVRQAALRGHDARTELLLYCVHGLLHLLGEDDHDDASYRQMHEREDAVLSAMGLGPVFRREPRDEGGRR